MQKLKKNNNREKRSAVFLRSKKRGGAAVGETWGGSAARKWRHAHSAREWGAAPAPPIDCSTRLNDATMTAPRLSFGQVKTTWMIRTSDSDSTTSPAYYLLLRWRQFMYYSFVICEMIIWSEFFRFCVFVLFVRHMNSELTLLESIPWNDFVEFSLLKY